MAPGSVACTTTGTVSRRSPSSTPRPTGAAADGTVTRPFAAIAQAVHTAHRLSASSDVVVHMAAGTYRLAQPLRFTSADSGQNGHTITYEGTAGQRAVMTGAQQVTGWTLQKQANNI